MAKPATPAPSRPAAPSASEPSASRGRSSTRSAAPTKGESGRHARRPPTRSKAPWIIGALVVLGVAGAFAYGPVMRSRHLAQMDKGGAEGLEGARRYYAFVGGSEALVREAITRGDFDAQLWLAKESASIAALMLIAERRDLPASQLATTLATAVAIFTPERDKRAREPAVLATWAKDHAEREVAIPAIQLKTAFAKANDDKSPAELFALIAAQPAQDPLRVDAALEGLAALSDGDNLGLAIGLLRSNASDQVVVHPALRAAIIEGARPSHVESLLGLTSSQSGPVRALALEALGQISLPENADPRQRQRIGEQVAAKLVPGTPADEMSAALSAVQGLRLTGARDALLALLPQREALALPGIDDAWWVKTLGSSLILTQPEAARPASEDLIAKLTALLDQPDSRSIAARALGSIRDPGFAGMRPALDKLAALGSDEDCFAALTAIVTGTYRRADVAKANGKDLARWQDFLAQDRPRYTRLREIIDWLAKNEGATRVTDGAELLRQKRDFLDAARDYLQPLLEDTAFVPPLGLEYAQVKEALRRTNDLGRDTRNFLAGANQH